MESPVQNPATPQAGTTSAKSSFGIMAIVLLIIGLIVGFVAGMFLPLKKSSVKQISEANIPVSISLFNNPLIYQWKASLQGQLESRNENTFTVKDDKGNSLVVELSQKPGRTTFFDTTKEATSPAIIELSSIPVGSYMRGDVVVLPGDKNRISGVSFEKFDKPQ